MAGGRPAGERNGGARGYLCTLPVGRMVKPLSAHLISFLRDYDIEAMAAMLDQLSPCSFEHKMDTFRKNREQFKKPNAVEAFPNECKAAKDEEDESDVEDEEGDVEDDDNKEEESESSEDEDDSDDEDQETLKLQVPSEGEPECKKPRLAQSSGCQTKAAV